MNVRSRQYSGLSDNSSIASALPLKRDQVGESRPAQTFEVRVRRAEMEKGDESPRGAMRS